MIPTQARIQELFEYLSDGRLRRRLAVNNNKAKVGDIAGCPNKAGYLRTTVDGTLHLNHRLIWLLFHGTWPKVVDHINGNKQDNRIENLRACTQLENSQNQQLRRSNTSGVKGVSWRPDKNRYRARITINGKEACLGHFLTLEEAEQAVVKARLSYHGEFANHG